MMGQHGSVLRSVSFGVQQSWMLPLAGRVAQASVSESAPWQETARHLLNKWQLLLALFLRPQQRHLRPALGLHSLCVLKDARVEE